MQIQWTGMAWYAELSVSYTSNLLEDAGNSHLATCFTICFEDSITAQESPLLTFQPHWQSKQRTQTFKAIHTVHTCIERPSKAKVNELDRMP